MAVGIGTILFLGTGLWLLLGGPAWLAVLTFVGLALIVMNAPRDNDGTPSSGPGWMGSNETTGV